MTANSKKTLLTSVPLLGKPTKSLLADIRHLIDRTRQGVAHAVNAGLVLLYWSIGKRIYRDVLGQRRAEYGERIVQTLSGQLIPEYGQGFSRANLFNMIRFAEAFPNQKIVQTLSGQLSWSHFVEIIALKDPLQREFYAEMCRIEWWNVRTLREMLPPPDSCPDSGGGDCAG